MPKSKSKPKRKSSRRQFVVSLKMPEGVTIQRMADYIAVAVGCWKGGMDPDDPLFDMDGNSVSARSMPAKK